MRALERTAEELVNYLPRALAAVVILVVGWIIAYLLAALVSKALYRIRFNERVSGGGLKGDRTIGWIRTAVFWIIMLLVLIAFFATLQLPVIADSLQAMLNVVLEYLPRLAAALILLLVAVVVAKVINIAVSKGLSAANFDQRIRSHAQTDDTTPIHATKIISVTAFWLIIVLFIPAILNALGLEQSLEPFTDMVGRVVAFLPNLFIAAVILALGFLAAKLVSKVVASLVASAGGDEFGRRPGVAKVLGKSTLSGILGFVVYVLILIPVIIAALEALQIQALTAPLSAMLNDFLAAIPNIVAAALVVLLAYVVGWLVAGIVSGLLSGLNFDALPARLGITDKSDQQIQQLEYTPSMVAGYVAMVVIVLFGVISAVEILGFEQFALVIQQLLVFAGNVILGLIILAIGLYLAQVADRLIRGTRHKNADMLALLGKAAIIVLAVTMALRQMGLAAEIISIAFTLTLGAVAVAAAIAFGVGGRDIARSKLQQWTQLMDSQQGSSGQGGGKSQSLPPKPPK